MDTTIEPTAYQWALPESLDVPRDELRCRLDFYRDAVVLYILEKSVITTRVVSANDVAMALLSEVPMGSGILPKDSLWWNNTRNGTEVALWRPPKVWQVALLMDPFKPPVRLRLPMPGLIFVCCPGRPPRVYAAKRRPEKPSDTIYHAPLFNVFGDGTTCPGTHSYPQNIEEIPESFFVSFFTPEAQCNGRSKKYPNDLYGLWKELNGKKKYPLSDLVPMCEVKDIMR